MARPNQHKDVEFAVGDWYTHNIEKAINRAFGIALSRGNTYLDVLVYSAEGAYWWGGDDAVEQYKIDPDASVFERLEIKINNLGMIP